MAWEDAHSRSISHISHANIDVTDLVVFLSRSSGCCQTVLCLLSPYLLRMTKVGFDNCSILISTWEKTEKPT